MANHLTPSDLTFEQGIKVKLSMEHLDNHVNEGKKHFGTQNNIDMTSMTFKLTLKK